MSYEIRLQKFPQHGPKLQALLDAPSARALLESQAKSGAFPVTTGSLPVSSAEALWLTSPSHCAEASEASLRRALLTADGAGRALKELALEELLRRHAGSTTSRQPEENTRLSIPGDDKNP